MYSGTHFIMHAYARCREGSRMMENTFLPVTQAINCSQLKICHAPGYSLSNSIFFISQTKLPLEKILKANYDFFFIETTWLQTQFNKRVLLLWDGTHRKDSPYTRVCTWLCSCPSSSVLSWLTSPTGYPNSRPHSSSAHFNQDSSFPVCYLKL